MLHHVLQNFRTSECDSWLGGPSRASVRADGQRRSVSDGLKRRELLEEFMYWFYESFAIPLLKVWPNGCPDSRVKFELQGTFYVTDSGAFKNRILYFRHDDWDRLCQPLVRDLMSKRFLEIQGEPVSIIPSNQSILPSLDYIDRDTPQTSAKIFAIGIYQDVAEGDRYPTDCQSQQTRKRRLYK